MNDWWDQLNTDQSKDEQKAKRLVNVIAKQPGSREQKLKWLVKLLPLLEAEAGKKFDPVAQPREFGCEMKSLTCRYWRAKVRQAKGFGPRRGSFERPQQQEGYRETELTKVADVLELVPKREGGA